MSITNENSGLVEERPLRELVLQLSSDVSRLVEQEVALAKQEARETLAEVQSSALALSAGVMILHVSVAALAAALTLVLSTRLTGWVAALIVGVVFAIAGGMLLSRGKRGLERVSLMPDKTVTSVKEDVKAIKEAAR